MGGVSRWVGGRVACMRGMTKKQESTRTQGAVGHCSKGRCWGEPNPKPRAGGVSILYGQQACRVAGNDRRCCAAILQAGVPACVTWCNVPGDAPVHRLQIWHGPRSRGGRRLGWVLLRGADQARSACSRRCCPAALDRLAARHMYAWQSPNPMRAAGLHAVLLCWLQLPPRAASGLTAPVHAR